MLILIQYDKKHLCYFYSYSHAGKGFYIQLKLRILVDPSSSPLNISENSIKFVFFGQTAT